MDWGEDYDKVVTACVSLVGSSVLRKGPRELEQRALQFTEGVEQGSVSAASWSLIQEMQRQLAVRVHKGTGLLTPDVWRIWLSMFAPGTALVLLQVHAVGAVRPLVFRVPGVAVQRYVGALMMDSHFMELQCTAPMADVEAWLEALPMFVPTLWCFDPKVVNAVVGSEFGCGPCGSTECSAVCANTDADSLWSLGKFECLIGMEDATQEQVSLQASLDGDLCWPEECSAEFQAPVVDTGIPKCGRVMSSEGDTADVWSALESMEGLKPLTGNTLGGVKALAHQGASLEAVVTSEKVKAAGSVQGEAAPEVNTGEVEWESV